MELSRVIHATKCSIFIISKYFDTRLKSNLKLVFEAFYQGFRMPKFAGAKVQKRKNQTRWAPKKPPGAENQIW